MLSTLEHSSCACGYCVCVRVSMYVCSCWCAFVYACVSVYVR